MSVLLHLLQTDGFMPHGHCYLWRPGLIGLHVTSDAVIGLSYVAISITLAYLVRRARGEVPFGWMLLAFGLFIIACGATHFMEVWTLWTPVYWLSGDIKAVTALASAATAIALPPLVPRALHLIGSAKLADERKRELETLYARLQELDALKTAFFANVSHELRTPLALILGPTERLAAAGNLTEGQRQDLGVVRRNARTLLHHVNDLLEVARLEAGHMAPRWAVVDFARLVRLAAAHFDALADARHVRLVVDVPERVVVEADPDQLGRVVMNLLSNAFKFVPDGGIVRCAIQLDDARAQLRVEDSGPGVPPHLRDAIFERFRQGDGGPDRQFGGTGLGLAIARDLVRLHDGAITVGDATIGGAAFVVDLPRRARPGVVVHAEQPPELDAGGVADTPPPAPGSSPAVHTGAGGARPLVLVVEDNDDMRRFVADVLAQEYRVATAADGREGAERAQAMGPDAIVTDVMMPRVAGEEFLETVRRCRELDGVPVIVLTARADDELRTRLLRNGAQDYLTKPFSGDELRARVGNQVSIKRARDVLQGALATRAQDLRTLAVELGARTRELERAADTTRAARDQAERASRVKTQFLNMVSHELRTPITAAENFLYVLLKDDAEPLSARQRELVGRAGGALRRLTGLVESLLEYARSESGRLRLNPEPVDLAAVARDVLDEFQPIAQKKSLALTLDAAPALASLVTDARLVRLVLGNLVGNAVKYTERGAVTVRFDATDGCHRLSVADTGPGIASELQDLAFEPFQQLEPLQQKHTPGVGLGLALVRQMVEALGGRIELQSAAGVGSTFVVLLRALDDGAEQVVA
jgi:signal transduction histidine kinase